MLLPRTTSINGVPSRAWPLAAAAPFSPQPDASGETRQAMLTLVVMAALGLVLGGATPSPNEEAKKAMLPVHG